MVKLAVLLAGACIALGAASAATNKVVCYHGIWSVYRQGNGNFNVDKIDPNLCTHIIYAFIGVLNDGSIRHIEENLDINRGNINKFNALKQRNPNLKTLVAIGGWGEGSIRFSTVTANPVTRANFIRSAVYFVEKWGFDGFDLDWEYPGQRGGAAADKQNFVTLIRELRQEFDTRGLLLTAAVAAVPSSVDLSYNVPELSKYLDLIHVMAYDLHGSWDGVTGQNAPLYASPSDQLTVDASIRGWLQRGADPQKIALGLGLYGRSYTLANGNVNAVGAPIVNAGNAGPYTGESGVLGYNEIVELQLNGGWTVVWDDVQKNPYAYKGNQWIGYDDPQSLTIKVEYAKSLNLGGVMIWPIETDDFNGLGGVKYPLLTAINKALGKPTENPGAPQPSPPAAIPTQAPIITTPKPTPAPTPSPTSKPTSPAGSSGSVCTRPGYVRDPSNCSIFYYCLPHNGLLIPLENRCVAGLVFDEETIRCDYPSAVQC